MGFLIAGSLYAAGALKESILIICGMETVFFGALTIPLAYYHRRWRLGFLGAVLSLLLPYFVNRLWINFSCRSLLYPVVTLVILGGVTVEMIHRKISGPQADDAIEEELIRTFIEEMDANFTWVDRVTWLCFTVGTVTLFVLLLR